MTLDAAIMFGVGVSGFAIMVLEKVVGIVRGVSSGEGEVRTQLAVLTNKVAETQELVKSLVAKQEGHVQDHTAELHNLQTRVAVLEQKAGIRHG